MIDRDWDLYQRTERACFGAYDNLNMTIYLLTDLRHDRFMNLTYLHRDFKDNDHNFIFRPIGNRSRQVFLWRWSSMSGKGFEFYNCQITLVNTTDAYFNDLLLRDSYFVWASRLPLHVC
jgi:hypothetical protein